MRFTRLLGFKLFLIIAGTMLISTLILTTLTISWHSRQYFGNTIQTVSRTSDVLKRSMHYSMLLNRREDIHQIIKTVGGEPGIEAVRIYNKRGEITFSSNVAEVGNKADLRHDACIACHVSGQIVARPGTDELTRVFQSSKGYRVVGMITPIPNESACSSAACHAHPEAQTILGVIDVMMPLSQLDASLADLRTVQYKNALIMVAMVTSIAGAFIWLMVNIPVRKLIRGTEEISSGNLDHHIILHTNDEIGTLADSFNRMTDDLRAAHKELTEWGHTLEQRVRDKTEELQRTQMNMIQVEKMASLGTLAATVAHELNNPLEGVLTYAKLLKRQVQALQLRPDTQSEIEGELSIIADETARCGNIVKNLLLFSRQKVGEQGEIDLAAILGQSFRLIEHHMKMSNIVLQTNLQDRAVKAVGDANQLEQAFLALEINAVEAMPEGGTLCVEVNDATQSDTIEIMFRDSGVGIRDEDLTHIFEPFYTTKQEGKGTGLGLAVVYGIIKRHSGSIEVESKAHNGTTFIVKLPRTPRDGDRFSGVESESYTHLKNE